MNRIGTGKASVARGRCTPHHTRRCSCTTHLLSPPSFGPPPHKQPLPLPVPTTQIGISTSPPLQHPLSLSRLSQPLAMDPRAAALMQGVLESRALRFFWNKRTFLLCADFTFRRYNGDEFRHSAAITSGTSVAKVGSTEFTVTFLQPDLHYHIRAGSSAERDRWVVVLADAIRKQSEAASPAAPPPPPASPAAPPPSRRYASMFQSNAAAAAAKLSKALSKEPHADAATDLLLLLARSNCVAWGPLSTAALKQQVSLHDAAVSRAFFPSCACSWPRRLSRGWGAQMVWQRCSSCSGTGRRWRKG